LNLDGALQLVGGQQRNTDQVALAAIVSQLCEAFFRQQIKHLVLAALIVDDGYLEPRCFKWVPRYRTEIFSI
jgi:hypothetical protein